LSRGNRCTHHFFSSLRVDRAILRTEAGCRPDGMGHRIGYIMKFKVKKNRAIGFANAIKHQWAVPGKKLQADFIDGTIRFCCINEVSYVP